MQSIVQWLRHPPENARAATTYRPFLLVLYFAGWACMGAAPALNAAEEDMARAVAKARLAVARRGLATVQKQADGANGFYRDTRAWSERVLKAELALSATPDDRIAALEAYLERTRRLQEIAKDGFAQRILSLADTLEADYNHLDAAALLAAERAKTTAPPSDGVPSRRARQ